MESERPDEGQPERDSDIMALEGLEAEFTDLEAELTRVEQSRGEGSAEPQR